MFAVLAWTAVEMERVSGLATLKPDALAAMHESPFVYLSSLSPQQVGTASFSRERVPRLFAVSKQKMADNVAKCL